jgi:peptide/nickel transport system substrate-binding protein
MKHNHWSIIVELLMVVSIVITACGGGQKATPQPGAGKQGGTLVMGFYQEPESLNPFLATHIVAGEVLGLFQRSLIDVSPEGEFVPDLAKEVPTIQNGLVSEDGLTIRYNLKEGIVWSDGDPFDCQDVVFTWEANVHFASGAVSTSGHQDIVSVTCEDDYTVVVKYKAFYAPYLTRFGAILPSHLGLDPAKMPEWAYNWDPISLGPFVMEEWVSGDHMTVVRNEKYEKWETEGKPYLDAIILRWIESREAGKLLIRTGELDFVWDLAEADIPEARTWEGIVVNNTPSPRAERLVFNTVDPELDAPCADFLRENPSPHWALGDLRVRQAIQLGIDKHRIVDKLLHGLASVGTSELNLGWAKDDIPESEYNPDKAMALLEEAGWTDEDGDGIRECHGCPNAHEGRVLKLKIQTTSGNALREEIQQVLIEMLEEVGMQLFIENVSGAELFAGYFSGAFRKHGQFDILMYMTGPGIDPHGHYEGYFASYNAPCDENSGTGFNYSRWINDEFDKWIEVAGSSPDLRVRADAYQKAAEQVAAELPHIYLYDRMNINLTVKELKGYHQSVWVGLTRNADEWWLER